MMSSERPISKIVTNRSPSPTPHSLSGYGDENKMQSSPKSFFGHGMPEFPHFKTSDDLVMPIIAVKPLGGSSLVLTTFREMSLQDKTQAVGK